MNQPPLLFMRRTGYAKLCAFRELFKDARGSLINNPQHLLIAGQSSVDLFHPSPTTTTLPTIFAAISQEINPRTWFKGQSNAKFARDFVSAIGFGPATRQMRRF